MYVLGLGALYTPVAADGAGATGIDNAVGAADRRRRRQSGAGWLLGADRGCWPLSDQLHHSARTPGGERQIAVVSTNGTSVEFISAESGFAFPGLLADYQDGTTVEPALSKPDIGRGPPRPHS